MRSGVTTAAVLALGIATAPVSAAAEQISDPLERMNRGIFWFNDKLDVFIVEPLAKGWDFVLPDRVQYMVRDVYDNAMFPVYFTNNLLQGKPRDAGVSLGRFALNTTLGMGGLFDPATDAGVPHERESFRETLGVWGAGSGPYLVLPFLGPSSIRDVAGRVVDGPLRIWPFYLTFWENAAVTGTERLNWRSLHIDDLAMAKSSSLDYYAAVRNAYSQLVEAQIQDREDDEDGDQQQDEEDLYFMDFDDEP